jgi:hypothetical protein
VRKIGVFAVAAAVTLALFTSFCNLMFACGCRAAWAGAAEHCNIHQPGVKHCPWCTHGGAGAWLAMGGILISQAIVSFWPGRAAMRKRLLFALALFPAAGAIIAVPFGLYSGYWT